MTELGKDFLQRAQDARQKLSDQYLNHPKVGLIDIGYDPESINHKEQIVLRIHIRQSATEDELQIPTEIDGIPVRVIRADYWLE